MFAMLYFSSAQTAEFPARSDDFGATTIGKGHPVEVFDPVLSSDLLESKIIGLWILPEACGVFSGPQNRDDTGFKYAVSLTMRFLVKSLELVLPFIY
jgi:hypothetical protein